MQGGCRIGIWILPLRWMLISYTKFRTNIWNLLKYTTYIALVGGVKAVNGLPWLSYIRYKGIGGLRLDTAHFCPGRGPAKWTWLMYEQAPAHYSLFFQAYTKNGKAKSEFDVWKTGVNDDPTGLLLNHLRCLVLECLPTWPIKSPKGIGC